MDLRSKTFSIETLQTVIVVILLYLVNSTTSWWTKRSNIDLKNHTLSTRSCGLDVKARSRPAIAKVQVASACIQLLNNDSGIVPAATSYIKSSTKVAVKLKAQKTAGP
ncbi:hypothetical protein CPB83DRAFT_172025 [Crepidotus variabilis]|uniref:Uncharacterized protein n=1 Tax=Crepidotus variabilis TaxID=179855 RepID=A0A9P6EL88_9AGAR|nr:hypothetical protein CPB83DRAFT_172025 [Crepidotus variabilis]